MEDSFAVRVDKVFGCLASSSTLSSLWSLKIEEREQNRERDTDNASADCQPDSSGVHDDLVKQLLSLSDLNDEEEHHDYNDDGCNHGAYHKVFFDIRRFIGLDCTLDYEEEGDEFDKLALGIEEAGDLLYERDIVGHETDHGNSHHNNLPSSFVKNVARDPRADHMAAKRRLMEDAETAGSYDCLKLSAAPIKRRMDARGDDQLDNIPIKGTATSQQKSAYSVPDYVRNPERYKRFTLDSSEDMDEESNQKICTEFFTLLKKQNSSVSSPKSSLFVPRKKAIRRGNEFKQSQEDVWKGKAFPAGIAAAGEAEDRGTEECPMEEEDEPGFVLDKKCWSSQTQDRKYRTRTNIDQSIN